MNNVCHLLLSIVFQSWQNHRFPIIGKPFWRRLFQSMENLSGEDFSNHWKSPPLEKPSFPMIGKVLFQSLEKRFSRVVLFQRLEKSLSNYWKHVFLQKPFSNDWKGGFLNVSGEVLSQRLERSFFSHWKTVFP